MGQLTVDFPMLDFYRRGLTLLGVDSLLYDTIACAFARRTRGLFRVGAPCRRRPRRN
jgi:hypothetical protein